MVITLVSCVLLALDSPDMASHTGLIDAVHNMSIAVSVLFCLEATLKIIALGFVMSRGSYLRDPWNMLDFGIAILSVLSAFLTNTVYFNGVRALRALRALKLISNFESTRTVMAAILRSLRAVFGVGLFGLLLFSMFAIIGVQFFGGSFRSCLLPSSDGPVLLELNEDECTNTTGAVWHNPIETGDFDDFGSALLVIFELSTQELWHLTMYKAIDAVGPGLAPEVEHNRWRALYFIIVVTV